MAGTTFTCPACHARMSSANPLPVGRGVRCGKCGAQFRIGMEEFAESEPNPYADSPVPEGEWAWSASHEPAGAPAEPTADAGYDVVDEAGEPPTRADAEEEPAPRGSRVKQGLVIAAVVVAVVAICGTLLYFLLPERDQPVAARPAPPPEPADTSPPRLFLDPAWPVWQVDPDLEDLLAPEVPLPGSDEYRFRPPRGYRYTKEPVAGITWQAWVGRVRDDGSRPWLGLTPYKPPPTAEPPRGLTGRLKRFLTDFRAARAADFPTVTFTAPEAGQMNDLAGARCQLVESNPEQDVTLHGFAYLLTDGTQTFVWLYHDRAVHADKTRKIAEASVQTLRK